MRARFTRLGKPLLLGAWFAIVVASTSCSKPEKPQAAPAKSFVQRGPLPPPVARYKDCNLVFVSFDALQAAHVGALGNPRDVTPALDAVAAQGYLFTEAMSVASWTVPASMTWFTGVYPSEHRMTNKFAIFAPPVMKPAKLKELSPSLVTLAEVLKEAGYATAGFTGNAGVSGGFGYEQGFDVYYYEPGKFGSFDQSMPRALDWLKDHRERKFFLFLHGYDMHGQNTPQDGYDYRFVESDYGRRFTGSEQEQELLREEGLRNGRVNVRPEDMRFWRAIYDEKIQRADAKFRNFLLEFDKLGITDRTLFVLTSDHGTELFEHQRVDHGFTLYDEQIHVPLVIKLPGQVGGRTISQRVSSIDLMPTILEILDVDVSTTLRDQLRGASLIPVMDGGTASRNIISETDYRAFTYKRSIIRPDGWKLIYTLEHGTRELYNLLGDPHERNDVARAFPLVAEELEGQLFEHFRSIGHDLQDRDWEVGLNPVYASQAQPEPASKPGAAPDGQ